MPRGIALLAGIAALGATASLHAATADPLIGSWRVTKGGSGTLVVEQTSSLFRLTAGADGLTLGCIDVGQGTVVGFVELPSHTSLPRGDYNASFGYPGQGCSYGVHLHLNADTIDSTILYTEAGPALAPFALARVGSAPRVAKTYAWTANTKAKGVVVRGSGRVSTDSHGRVLGSSGSLVVTLGSATWRGILDPPGQLRRGANGAFTLSLTINVSSGDCLDRTGTLVVTKSHAVVNGICSAPEIAGTGTTKLR